MPPRKVGKGMKIVLQEQKSLRELLARWLIHIEMKKFSQRVEAMRAMDASLYHVMHDCWKILPFNFMQN